MLSVLKLVVFKNCSSLIILGILLKLFIVSDSVLGIVGLGVLVELCMTVPVPVLC